MKKFLMLLVAVLGTTVMVSVQTAPAKATSTKEVKAAKKTTKKEETSKIAAPVKTTTAKK